MTGKHAMRTPAELVQSHGGRFAATLGINLAAAVAARNHGKEGWLER